MEDGFVFRGGVTAVFPIHNRLDIEAGGFAWTRLEDDPLFVPYATIDWRPTDDLEVSSDGLNLGLRYNWGRDILTYATVGFVERQYRLDEAEVGIAVGNRIGNVVGVVIEDPDPRRVAGIAKPTDGIGQNIVAGGRDRRDRDDRVTQVGKAPGIVAQGQHRLRRVQPECRQS